MADRERIPNLSKSRFMAGLQCHKRLYLALYQAGLAEAPGPGQQAILDQGTQVGVLARGYVPGGVLIDEDSTLHDAAMAHTRQALADAALPALYEAAFAHDEVAVRVDLLLRAGGNAFDVIEVKSSTQVKEEHLWDLAIQAHVLEGAGLEVRNYAVLHINRDYVYPGGEHDLRQLFALAGVSDAVRGLVPRVPELLAAMREPLWAVEPPPVDTGDHCHAPYDCPFIAHCHAGGPEHPVGELPRAGKALRNSLANDGIGAVPEIPADYPGLTDLHARVREAVVSGQPYHDPAIGAVLRSLEHPLHFLDFETINPAVPLYPGTRPYDQIPFQWSLHRLDAGGAMSHSEFLHDGPDDPRPHFTAALVEALGERGRCASTTTSRPRSSGPCSRSFPTTPRPSRASWRGWSTCCRRCASTSTTRSSTARSP